MSTTTQTIGGKARLFPSLTAQTAIASTVRQIGGKIEVQWDGITWTDESDYLLTAKGNIKMSGDLGEGIASTADFELDNTTDRFLPENIDSLIYEYLLPRTKIRYSVKISSYYFKLFTGYIKGIDPDRRSGIVDFHCFDETELVLNQPAPRDAAYINKRADELITILAEAAGITSSQYDIEQSNHTISAAYFGDRYTWPLMGEIAVSERGRVFFDYDGVLKFWAQDHIHKQQNPIFTLTRNDWLKNLNFSVEEQSIKNKITVKAKPRVSAGIKVVWTNGDVQVLNQYSSTLVWIPAHNQQEAYIDITDDYGELPCTNYIQPIPYTDFTASTAADGITNADSTPAIDLTASIQITTFIDYASSVFIVVNNYSDYDVYLTKFQIRANPLPIWKWIKIIQRDELSISRYGEQTIDLENDFIDSEDFALEIAQVEIDRWKNAKNSFKGDILGIPHLKCGDVVSLEIMGPTYMMAEDGSYITTEDGDYIITRDSIYENYMINEIDWEVDEQGFLQSLGFVNPISIPVIQTISAYARIKGERTQTISALAYIQPTKSISAKADIKVNTSKSMNALGRIIKT